jgi:hypothetical protein
MADLKRTIEILESQKQSIIKEVYKTGNSFPNENNDYIGFTGTSGTVSFYVSEEAWNEIKKIMISDYNKRISELEKKL